MFCKYCGKEIDNSAKFCNYCGKEINGESNTKISSKKDADEEKILKCTNGILKVYNDRVIISRRTTGGIISQGLKGDKTFFYEDLINVEYQKPSIWANGYMRFITAGINDNQTNVGLFGNMSIEAGQDTNTVILRAFNKQIPKKSEELYEYIMDKLKEYKNTKNTIKIENMSVADEILKFKNLLDQGIITMEEFEIKKKELLR